MVTHIRCLLDVFEGSGEEGVELVCWYVTLGGGQGDNGVDDLGQEGPVVGGVWREEEVTIKVQQV